MIDDKKLKQFTLVDIIERKIHFTNTNTIYDKTEFKDNDDELLAYYGEVGVIDTFCEANGYV